MGFSAASARPGSPQHQRQTVPYEFSHYQFITTPAATIVPIRILNKYGQHPPGSYSKRTVSGCTVRLLVLRSGRPAAGLASGLQGARGSGPQMGHQTAAQTVFSRFQPEPIKGVVARPLNWWRSCKGKRKYGGLAMLSISRHFAIARYSF